MKSLTSLLLPLLAASLVPGGGAVGIQSVRYSGDGCPQDSVSVNSSLDMEFITLGFDKFTPYIGPGTSSRDRYRNCAVQLILEPAEASRFVISASTYHGYARLDAGVSKTFSSTYYFAALDGPVTTTRTTIEGGGDLAHGQVFTRTERVQPEDYVLSPCSRPGEPIHLDVLDRVVLQSTNSSSSVMIPDDGDDVPLTQQIHLIWSPCS
ncbi:hypothetical protein MFIFM68171_02621 [Madurella fahalii]|uniref:Secreted protein n=1 Tax=Madurella fahalii TaxID=1157608 RepID=A0ABQ0G3S1_9PEZI